MYEIVYAKSAKKNIDAKSQKKLKKEIEKLRFFPHSTQIKRLKSYPFADFRLRVGEYRVLFDVDLQKNNTYT